MILQILRNSKFWIGISLVSLVAIIMLLSKRIDKSILIIDHVWVDNERDIQPITKELVVPILYRNVSILNELEADRRKDKFIDVVLPAVLIYRHQLAQKIHRLEILQERLRYSIDWSSGDSLFVSNCFSSYKTRNINELLEKMQPPPTSLCLAQAALESGWGTSRFFKEGNNAFGIWSFNDTDKRILAAEDRGGKPVYLKKYDNLLGSVEDYHLLLASSDVYRDFRACVQRDNNVFELIWYLRSYSERRNQYVIMLRNVIVSNDLTQYDNYQINPEFFDYPTAETPVF